MKIAGIKFRGMTKEGKWVYGSYLKDYYSTKMGKRIDAIVYPREGMRDTREPVIRETVGMFTGKQDKNGNGVYTGDKIIDLYNNKEYTIIWSEQYLTFIALDQEYYEYYKSKNYIDKYIYQLHCPICDTLEYNSTIFVSSLDCIKITGTIFD